MIKTQLGYAHVLSMTRKDNRSHAEIYASALEKQAEGSLTSARAKLFRNARRLIKYVISITGLVGVFLALTKGFWSGIAMDLMWQGVLRNLGI